MRDNDGRKLDHKTLEALRLRAVDQVQQGAHPEEVALALGGAAADAQAVDPDRGDRPAAAAVRVRVVDPEMLRELIRREFGVGLSVVSVGRLLVRMGLSPQRPAYRAYQQDSEAVRRWKEQEYTGPLLQG